jgi:hypothetical protein
VALDEPQKAKPNSCCNNYLFGSDRLGDAEFISSGGQSKAAAAGCEIVTGTWDSAAATAQAAALGF